MLLREVGRHLVRGRLGCVAEHLDLAGLHRLQTCLVPLDAHQFTALPQSMIFKGHTKRGHRHRADDDQQGQHEHEFQQRHRQSAAGPRRRCVMLVALCVTVFMVASPCQTIVGRGSQRRARTDSARTVRALSHLLIHPNPGRCPSTSPTRPRCRLPSSSHRPGRPSKDSILGSR